MKLSKLIEFKCSRCHQAFYIPMLTCMKFLVFLEKKSDQLIAACPICSAKEGFSEAETTHNIVVLEPQDEKSVGGTIGVC